MHIKIEMGKILENYYLFMKYLLVLTIVLLIHHYINAVSRYKIGTLNIFGKVLDSSYFYL